MAWLAAASLSYSLYHLLWSGLDLLFPPQCGGCGSAGSRWCCQCASSVKPPPDPVCILCGVPLQDDTDLCRYCAAERPAYRALRSWTLFEGSIRQALHRLKYRRDIALGEALTPQLARRLAALDWPVDLLIPVPLGRKRLAERGYNQVGLIARPLAMAMRIAYQPHAVVRSHETRSQVGLSRVQRQENVRSAFEARRSVVLGRTVLLMDDVATTGSTLSSCAEALYRAGARDVFAYTVSRAHPRHGLSTA